MQTPNFGDYLTARAAFDHYNKLDYYAMIVMILLWLLELYVSCEPCVDVYGTCLLYYATRWSFSSPQLLV